MKFLLLFAVILGGCNMIATLPNGIPNLAEVGDGIYRGGQPTKGGWDYLKTMGVNNVVKLNTDAEGSDDYAVSIGMTVHHFPLDIAHQILLKPSPETIWGAVEAIKPGTYIHCEHGQDRTGLVCACYRVFKGWKKPAAEEEMMKRGFHRTLHGLWEFWEDRVP